MHAAYDIVAGGSLVSFLDIVTKYTIIHVRLYTFGFVPFLSLAQNGKRV